jgi:hypothetical protein
MDQKSGSLGAPIGRQVIVRRLREIQNQHQLNPGVVPGPHHRFPCSYQEAEKQQYPSCPYGGLFPGHLFFGRGEVRQAATPPFWGAFLLSGILPLPPGWATITHHLFISKLWADFFNSLGPF